MRSYADLHESPYTDRDCLADIALLRDAAPIVGAVPMAPSVRNSNRKTTAWARSTVPLANSLSPLE